MKSLPLFLCIFVLSVAMPVAMHADLISHWTMDGGDTEDNGPGGNDGTFIGFGDPVLEPGFDGTDEGAITFSGAEYILLTPNTGLPVYANPQFSIAMWVKGMPQPDYRVFSEGSSTNNNMLFNIGTESTGATGQVDIFIRNAGGGVIVGHRLSTGFAFDGTWHHIIWTDDNGNASLYIDGVKDATDFTYIRPTDETDTPALAGVVRPARDPPLSHGFIGALDDVKIYDHILTQEEIDELVVKECPADGDDDFADTHCDVLFVEGPPENSPGTYTATAFDAFDDTLDPILYTFTADDGQGTVLTAGPQPDNFTTFDLGDGTWTISVTVDDDIVCEDEANDAICSEEISVGCPTEGDTHCGALSVVGTEDNTPGNFLIQAEDDIDDSLDTIIYTWTLDNGVDEPLVYTVQAQNFLDVLLTPGDWTVTLNVDDDPVCDDVADDAECSVDINVVADPPGLVSHWALDGDLDDSVSGNDGSFWGDVEPVFVEGFDGNAEGAIGLDGVDDLIEVQQNRNLPIYAQGAYTVAMWVNGLPQVDMRVFSEGSTVNQNPLLNIGTDNTGNTGEADIYIRNNNSTIMPHRHSAREAFDGNWHHLAWVDDNGQAALYIDGVRDATNFSYERSPLTTLNTTSIGGIIRAGQTHWFMGAIDDVRLYNYALSEEEVLTLVPEPDGCPEDGDTHCDNFIIDGPEGNLVGDYMLTSLDATDDSGDPILYTFVAQSDTGERVQFGPDVIANAQLRLNAGTWTITLTVDDDLLCRDVAVDAVCSQEITVVKPDPITISHWTFDSTLDDSQPAANHGEYIGEIGPPYVPDRDDNPDAAISFDGVDDYVLVSGNPEGGLPVFNYDEYTIAMWVKAPSQQRDKRVYSESSTINNSELFNIGTHNTAADGTVDLFIRDAGGGVAYGGNGHRHSVGVAFDDTWHHLAWVDVGGDAVLYIDGEPDATDFSYTKQVFDLDTVTIGGIYRASHATIPVCCVIDGAIDDAQIFNYPLTQEQIQELITGIVIPEGVPYIRGDANSDGAANISDASYTLNFLFLGGPDLPCEAGGDANSDNVVNISDASYTLNFLFLGGPDIAAPNACGAEPLADEADCLESPACEP